MLGAMPRAGLGCRAAALILLLVACLAAPWCARDGSARARVVARGVVLTTDLRQGSVTLAHDAIPGVGPASQTDLVADRPGLLTTRSGGMSEAPPSRTAAPAEDRGRGAR